MTDFSGTAELSEALARLDEDIAEAEQRVAELRAMRASVQPFIDKYMTSGTASGTFTFAGTAGGQRPASLTDAVITVFEEHPNQVLDVDDTLTYVRANGVEASRDAVRNAINYAVKLKKVGRDEPRRGRYFLKDTSTPAATGVDVGEEPDEEGSSGEIGGGRDEPSTPPHDQGGGALDARIHRDRDGDRAPIEA